MTKTLGAVTRTRSVLGRWGVLIVAVVIWEIATRAAGSVFFPPPTQIAAQAARMWLSGPASQLWLGDMVFRDVLPSLTRIFGSWLFVAVVGVAAGIVLGRSPIAMQYVGPVLDFARSLPSPALVPVFLVLFSIGTSLQVATIIFGTVFTVLLNTVDGARSVDAVQTDTAEVFRVRRMEWLLGVVLPAAGPKIFAGLRISLAHALILMVVSEMIGATNGIGYQLVYAQRQFDFPGLWASMVLLGVLGYLLNALLLGVQQRALRWQPTQSFE